MVWQKCNRLCHQYLKYRTVQVVGPYCVYPRDSNVRFENKYTKRSSNTLLRLVYLLLKRTLYHVTKPKLLTKYEQPKMKRHARQKCSLFLVHSYFIRALVGIWKMTARGDRKIKTFFFFCSFTRNMEDNWRVANLFTHQKHFFCQNSQDWQFNSSKYFS